MKEVTRFIVLKTIWQVIEAALIITLGVVIITNNSAALLIGIVTGILIVIDAGLRLALYFLDVAAQAEKSGVIFGIAELVLGIFVCTNPSLVADFLTLFIVLLVLIIGGVLVLDGLTKHVRRKTYPTPLPLIILEYVGGGLLLTAGIAGLIFTYSQDTGDVVKNVLLIIIGVILIASGIFEIGYSIGVLVITLRARKVVREAVDEVKKETEEKETVVTVDEVKDEPKEEDPKLIETEEKEDEVKLIETEE